VDVLPSLSRLMRRGTGAGKTRADHPAIAAQLYASLAQAQRAQEMAELLGTAALSPTDRRYLDLADAFERRLMSQGAGESRTIEETLERAWEVASILPRRELMMVSRSQVEAFYQPGGGGGPEPGGGDAAAETASEPGEG
jgi:V/A-type H+-transporting ATPase subunit B